MTQLAAQPLSHKSLNLLSRLLFSSGDDANYAALAKDVLELKRTEFESLVALAETNHVLVRALDIFKEIAQQSGDSMRAEWAAVSLAAERSRITTALSFLARVSDAFHERRLAVTVIKSLDHLPDLGSDLDLYTDAKPEGVIRLMEEGFNAHLASRSWGDRLACKWNFIVPGLPELIEIHVGRLGQTGEQSVIACSILGRTRVIAVEGKQFRVPGSSDRLMISTLQRMYRHFYFRLCDIIDSAQLIESGDVEWNDLYAAATTAGIWEGVATYLAIVSDYVDHYRHNAIVVPQWVLSSARFGGKQIYFAKDFLRVPILPQSAKLYGTQLASVLKRRQIQCSARLSLLPWLATAALVGQKITGSDKGVW